MTQVHGVCFLLIRNGLVMLEQCPKKAKVLGFDEGTWFVPGGKCEPGEPPLLAMRREMREELGLSAREFVTLPIIEGSPVNVAQQIRGVFLMRPYAVYDWEGKLTEQTLDEGVPLCWFGIHDALGSVVPQVRAMVAMAMHASPLAWIPRAQ